MQTRADSGKNDRKKNDERSSSADDIEKRCSCLDVSEAGVGYGGGTAE